MHLSTVAVKSLSGSDAQIAFWLYVSTCHNQMKNHVEIQRSKIKLANNTSWLTHDNTLHAKASGVERVKSRFRVSAYLTVKRSRALPATRSLSLKASTLQKYLSAGKGLASLWEVPFML